MTNFMGSGSKEYTYSKDNDKGKKVKGTKNCAMKQKIKWKNFVTVST